MVDVAERPPTGGIVLLLCQCADEVRLMDSKTFLADLELRPLTLADAGALKPLGLMIGPGAACYRAVIGDSVHPARE